LFIPGWIYPERLKNGLNSGLFTYTRNFPVLTKEQKNIKTAVGRRREKTPENAMKLPRKARRGKAGREAGNETGKNLSKN